MNSASSEISWFKTKWQALTSILWPIQPKEAKMLVPMFLMIFFININYSILRNMKDVVIMTSQHTGAEVIPFIKVWVLLPMAIILTIIFTKLSNYFSQERVFYFIISGFLVFFALFAFLFYPNQELIHPHAWADQAESYFPKGMRGFVAMLRNWSFTLFYVMSELWGSMVLSVLFWGFANEVTRVSEARRFYSMFGVSANLAAILAGQLGAYFSRVSFDPHFPFGSTEWEQTIVKLVIIVLLCGLVTIGLFRWMNKKVFNDPIFDDLHYVKRKANKREKKISFRESFKLLSSSNYLIYIAIIVFSYNLVINLIEVVWKDQLNKLYPNPADMNYYMNNLTTFVGLVSTVLAFALPYIISRLGWTKTALITPISMLITALGFFAFFLFGKDLEGFTMAFFGASPLVIAVFFGFLQNCLSKACKYSVFDSTKEMSFIPLDHETKLKGKAAIDGVGSRFGKSGGSVIHQGLWLMLGSLASSASYVAVILCVAIFFWIIATRRLGSKFQELIESKHESLTEDEELSKDTVESPAVIPNKQQLAT